jgi:hypothetical protein
VRPIFSRVKTYGYLLLPMQYVIFRGRIAIHVKCIWFLKVHLQPPWPSPSQISVAKKILRETLEAPWISGGSLVGGMSPLPASPLDLFLAEHSTIISRKLGNK